MNKTNLRLAVLGSLLSTIAMAENPFPVPTGPSSPSMPSLPGFPSSPGFPSIPGGMPAMPSAPSTLPGTLPTVPKIDPRVETRDPFKVVPNVETRDPFKVIPKAETRNPFKVDPKSDPKALPVPPKAEAPVKPVAKPELAPMPREVKPAVVAPVAPAVAEGGAAKPAGGTSVAAGQTKPMTKPSVPQTDIFRSTPNLFPTTPRREETPAEAKPAPGPGARPSEAKPEKGLTMQQSLEKILGAKSAYDQFQAISNLDLLEVPNREQLRERIADLDPTLNRAQLVGRNFELLGTKLFADALDGVYVQRRKDGGADLVIRFKDGSHITFSQLALTDEEIAALVKDAKLTKNFHDTLNASRGAGGVRVNAEVFGDFHKITKPADALALLGQFTLHSGVSGFAGTWGKPETFASYSHYVARDRRKPAAPASRPMGKADGKATHDKR